MSDENTDSMQDLPAGNVTHCGFAYKEFKVLGETEEHYVIQKEDGTPGAIEKEKATVVVISGLVQ